MRKMMRFLLAVTFVYFAVARAQTGTACPMLACAINCTYSQKLDANGCRTCECLDPCKDKVCPLGKECRVVKKLAVCVKKECPLIKCRACNSGYRLNYDGCQTCSCLDPCEYHKCEEGQVCTKKEVQCIIAPCYKVAACTVCPQIRCIAPCKSGYRVDSNKCQTCSCVDPCEYPKCEEGQVCTSKEVQCIRAPCYKVANCTAGTACPMLACAINCTYSQKLDANGCRTCECLDPCKDKVCPRGEECRVEKELAVCQKACPQIRCFVPCKSGYRKDSNKCQTCSCVDPCEYHKCEDGQVCTSKKVQCIIAPCYKVANCTVIPVCPQIRCIAPCKSGYREDSNKCRTCECVDPCEYPRCEKGEVCKRQQVSCFVPPCYDTYECVKECPLYKCAPCNHGYKVDKNGCQTCDCLPPRGLNCGGVLCSKGQICKKEVAPCLIPPCPVIGRCYNTTSV